jgi:hypothetical protein
MPVLAYFAVAGSVLVALLFVADATLEKNNSPVIVTSQRSGLPRTPQHPDAVQIITPAPAPDMTAQAVLNAQPKSEPGALAKIHPEARAARAEALPKKTRVEGSAKSAWAEALLSNKSIARHYEQNQFDRFSIKGY